VSASFTIRAPSISALLQLVNRASVTLLLCRYAFWFEGYHEDFIEDDPMRSLVWPSVSCRLFDSIIVVCCDGRRTVTKGFRCVFNGDSVAFEPLHSSRLESSFTRLLRFFILFLCPPPPNFLSQLISISVHGPAPRAKTKSKLMKTSGFGGRGHKRQKMRYL
jgi:hypothetical protein